MHGGGCENGKNPHEQSRLAIIGIAAFAGTALQLGNASAMPMSGLANASVCYERGLNFCVRLIASSAARLRLAVITAIHGYRTYGGGGCRTITIERGDGIIRRVTRCD